MSRIGGIAAIVGCLLVGGAAPTAAAVNALTLRSVERAFYQARVPFSYDWQRTAANPYLVPTKPSAGPSASLPRAFGPHLIGSASYLNAKTFKSRVVYVFDSPSIALTYRSWIEHHCTCRGSVILLAHNVAYLGSPSAAVRKAMTRLASP